MFPGMFASPLFTTHLGQAGGRGLSPRLWHKAYRQAMSPDGDSNGYWAGDDFLNFPGVANGISGDTAGKVGGYGYYTDTATSACSIQALATEVGGVARWALGATDNHEAWLSSGGNSGVLGKVSDTAGSNKLLIFETRVRFGQITEQGGFFGLAEEGLAAANTVADNTGALADKDVIGFHYDTAAASTLDFVYNKAGAGGVTVKIAGLKTLVASTFYKFGFIFDPEGASPSQRIKVFVDNIEQSTYVTDTNIAAAGFPDGEELAFLAGLKTGEAGAKTFDMDWWAFHQAA